MSKIYSLSQRWSPATSLDEDNQLCRPHFQVIMNETTGDLVAVNVSRHRFCQRRLVQWALDQPLVSQGELWVDKSEWLPAMTDAFPTLEVKLGPKAPYMQTYFEHLERSSQDRLTADDYCLLDLFGERTALRFYKAAWNYMEDHPLRVPVPAQELEYSDRRGVIYKLGYDPDGHPGLTLVLHDNTPLIGVAFDTPAFVAARDLELLDRNKLNFGPTDYPWIFFRPLPHGLTRPWLEELTWLLESLPDFLSKTSGEAKRRQLRWHSDPYRSKNPYKFGVRLQARALNEIDAISYRRKYGCQAFGDGGRFTGEIDDQALGSDSGCLPREDCGWDRAERYLPHELAEPGQHLGANRFGGFGGDIAQSRARTTGGHHQTTPGTVTQLPQRRFD